MKPDRHIIRRMGYLRDQDGIMNRYLRESTIWKDHLYNTRKFILESFSDPAIESVAVLGSGWLLDVPLETMAKRYHRVILADIRHPPQVRRKVREMENVQLVESDLTGGAVEYLWQITRRKTGVPLEKIVAGLELAAPVELGGADAMVSVNLVNQLDILVCDHLRDRGYFQHEPPDALRQKIQRFHISWLASRPGCLVTDTREINRDKEGNETVKPLLYTGLPDGFRSGQWEWEFDTHGTYHAGTRTTMEVRAIEWT